MAQPKLKSVGKDAPLLSISLQVEAPKTIDVAGEIYDIYSAGHIGADKETELLAQFQLLNYHSVKLEGSTDKAEARKWAKKLRETQIDIISTLTSIPEAVSDKFGAFHRLQLMDILAKEAGFDRESEATDEGDRSSPNS